MTQKYEIRTVKVSNLLANVSNPRFDSVENQRDAMDVMIREQKDKLIVLASDIVEEGTNPSELVIVAPTDDGRFKVLEGNRRVICLKFLNNPVLLKDKHKNVFKRFKVLSQKFKENPIDEIQCVVFKNEADANRWIKLKHTGENRGKGTVSWDAQQIARFDSMMDKKSSIGLQALDFVSTSIDEQLAHKLKKASITNLERLLTDKNVQEVIGIRIVDGVLESDLLKEEAQKGLLKIIKDIADKKIKVKDIYTKNDRKQYLESFNPQKDIPNKKSLADTAWRLDSNAGAVLMRVFFELSVDTFCEQMKIPRYEKDGRQRSLHQKMTDVLDYMVANGIAKETELKQARVALSSKHDLTSIDTFHAYVHSKHFQPDPKSLRIGWDNLQSFFEKIWNNIP